MKDQDFIITNLKSQNTSLTTEIDQFIQNLETLKNRNTQLSNEVK